MPFKTRNIFKCKIQYLKTYLWVSGKAQNPVLILGILLAMKIDKHNVCFKRSSFLSFTKPKFIVNNEIVAIFMEFYISKSKGW